ncbi:MAG: TrkA family potassium uptake protein [Chloroflexi bacterium]|nr:TrkA family potassium uptake protein [Chloroflexota bacterium]MBT4074732.1 TrkA family potassium uptake protein [Chloroflexota bacterium]MBT4514431.1 TrkA family potassium uptake protein [Chloroflexota bacterium]MBT5319775.1 TrkA family potassium uptake protein [Chloroflexota bacterium]MBT6682075.1 TrkA family potassium uptake protein [Chloroflexota bacterium]
MNVVIMGSGRIGARIASSLATDGHVVSIIEPSRTQVMNLPRAQVDSGEIRLVVGDGSSSVSMLDAGIEDADVFLALSGDDALNGLAAQKAKTVYRTRRVVCRVKDEGLRELYTSLGITVTSPTTLVSDVILQTVPDIA